MNPTLWHQFTLVTDRDLRPTDYSKFWMRSDLEKVRVPDDVCIYIYDSLNWIPTINPAFKDCRAQTGLNLYGVTGILPKGARIASKVFSSWAALFRLAPDEITLSAAWEAPADSDDWERSRICLRRNDLVQTLESAANISMRASQESHFLIHFGL